jgi:4'-phosphopantetheinyl transferase EntD
VIEEILPSTVAAFDSITARETSAGEAVAAHADGPGNSRWPSPHCGLFPEEEAAVRHASDKRRQQFTQTRRQARAALAALGLPPAAILPARDRAPTWPPGTVGSITHCTGYAATALARIEDLTALGIDAEPYRPLPPALLERITGPQECAELDQLSHTDPELHGGCVLFSAKESVYKAWSPLTGLPLGFQDVVVTLTRPAERWAGTFTAFLPQGGPLERFAGRWLISNGLVVTAVTVGTSTSFEDLSTRAPQAVGTGYEKGQV